MKLHFLEKITGLVQHGTVIRPNGMCLPSWEMLNVGAKYSRPRAPRLLTPPTNPPGKAPLGD